MANSSPFIEEETEDIRQRFRTRIIDWNLLKPDVSSTARDFIRRLLEINPRTRMSCTAALEHLWLQSTFSTAGPSIEYPTGLGSQVVHDPSVISMRDVSGVTFGQSEVEVPDSYIHVDVDGGSADSIGSQLATPVPGDFPSSQGASSQRRPMIRRAHELGERDPEGILQQLDLVAPGESSAQGSKAPNDQANGNGHASGSGNGNGRKRKVQPDADDMDDSDSSLTPVSDGTVDGVENGDMQGADNSPGRAAGGYQLRNVKKKQDVPVVKAPPGKSRRK